MTVKLQSSRVAITGAGSGIGAATAVHCARIGAETITLDIDGDAAEATAQRCRELGGAARAYTCDVTDYEALVALAQRLEDEHGPVDVLVNNAGVGLAGRFLEGSIEDWRWLREVDIDGVVHGCHAFAPAMVQRGRGHLVNVSSMAGYMPHASMASYCTAKAAVLMFSQCLRADLAADGVGVSAVCPGVIDTPIAVNTRLVGAMASNREQIVGVFRHGHSPEAVAKAVVRAIERNREVAPVGIESSVAYRTLRFSPDAVRGRLARVQPR